MVSLAVSRSEQAIPQTIQFEAVNGDRCYTVSHRHRSTEVLRDDNDRIMKSSLLGDPFHPNPTILI